MMTDRISFLSAVILKNKSALIRGLGYFETSSSQVTPDEESRHQIEKVRYHEGRGWGVVAGSFRRLWRRQQPAPGERCRYVTEQEMMFTMSTSGKRVALHIDPLSHLLTATAKPLTRRVIVRYRDNARVPEESGVLSVPARGVRRAPRAYRYARFRHFPVADPLPTTADAAHTACRRMPPW